MNCQTAAGLVNDQIDNSLSADLKIALDQHLESCARCRDEYEIRLSLRQRLAEFPRPALSNSYWKNQAELIFARTIEQKESIESPNRRPHTSDEVRRSFYRSLLAAAASITILVGSLTLGMSSKYAPVAVIDGESKATITPALASKLEIDPIDQIFARELASVHHAKMLLGPPGSVSRISLLNDLVVLK